jgi:hypothetical protein
MHEVEVVPKNVLDRPATCLPTPFFCMQGVAWCGGLNRQGVVNARVTPEGLSQSSGPRVMRRWP